MPYFKNLRCLKGHDVSKATRNYKDLQNNYSKTGVLLDHEVVWFEPPTLKIPNYKKIDMEKIFNSITNEHFQSALEHDQLLEWSEFYRSLQKKQEK